MKDQSISYIDLPAVAELTSLVLNDGSVLWSGSFKRVSDEVHSDLLVPGHGLEIAMVDQLQLSLRSPAPAVTQEDVAVLVNVLSDRTIWVTAGDLALQMPGYTDRKIRAIAAAAMPQIVSYPGSPGYRLFQHCTIEEINHCIESFESQGRDMLKRAVLYRQAYHRRFRGDSKLF